MTFAATLGKHLIMMVLLLKCFISQLTGVAASNINIKTHQLFSKQQILDVHVTIVQREILGDLRRTCF